jgi:hypothetical protein
MELEKLNQKILKRLISSIACNDGKARNVVGEENKAHSYVQVQLDTC